MRILQILFIGIVCLFIFMSPALAINSPCASDDPRVECKFGTITPPSPIAGFLGPDITGAEGISKFLSNLVILIYIVAAVVLIFMLLWGAFDWMISEGNKEKLQAAQNKIISAIVGILLFAVAFAIISILGQFTGFTFFTG